MSDDPVPVRVGGTCPTCGRPTEARFRPFCSKRCRDVDLHRWLTGAYAIPAASDDGPADDDGAD